MSKSFSPICAFGLSLTLWLGGTLSATAAPTKKPLPARKAVAVGYSRAYLDTSVRPQDDFYEYAVGGYLKKHPIPADRSSYGVDAELNDRIEAVLHNILDGLAARRYPTGTDDQRLSDFYASAMNVHAIEAAGIKPLRGEMQRIDAIGTYPQLQDEVARLHRDGMDVVFDFGPDQDFKNPDMVIGEFSQGGLSLPDRDYYVLDDEDKKKVRTAFVAHVAKMLSLAGDAHASTHADQIMAIETRLAKSSMSADEMRNPPALYNPSTVAALEERTPSLNWNRYFDAIRIARLRTVNVQTPKFFADLDATLHAFPLDAWKAYLRWHLLDATAPYLSAKFDHEDFEFNEHLLSGVPQQKPRWRRAIGWTDRYLGEALGREFVKNHFPPAAKARAVEMVENIKAVVRDRIQKGWMDKTSQAEALRKVNLLVAKIGYPDRWKNYAALHVDRGVLADNALRAMAFAQATELARIGHPVDRHKWDMTPSTVNAYYDPQKNEIVFPAAILQPPYFDLKADDAANYGETGATIGHELTHGFDDEGSQFDAKGNLRSWWTQADKTHFDTLGNGVARQFSEFVYDGQKVDGKRVEGESIADLGGLEIAYAAFKIAEKKHPEPPTSDGFTPDQRFFLNYALSWATNIRPARAHLQISSNPHPLAQFRVNGPLANMPAFWAAFNVKPGDKMRRDDALRNKIWDP